jgi:hypothetical protein
MFLTNYLNEFGDDENGKDGNTNNSVPRRLEAQIMPNRFVSDPSKVDDANKEFVKVADPLINNIGINSVISQTQTIVSQVTIMGNLNKNEIPILIDFLGDTLIKDLMVNKLKYGIVSTEARDKIHYLAVSSAFICMKRAFEEGDRRFWGKVQQELTTTIKGQEQKQGIFQKMLGWAK